MRKANASSFTKGDILGLMKDRERETDEEGDTKRNADHTGRGTHKIYILRKQ